jgi:hypothetical protein
MTDSWEQLPTREDLTKLPLRAIVAYAARSARRVQSMYVDSRAPAKRKLHLEQAISLVEEFCLGRDIPAAFGAAAYAYYADDALIRAGRTDYDRLLELNLGAYPELGQPINPTSEGPLGPLWQGRTVFFLSGEATEPQSEVKGNATTLPALEVFVDPGGASKEAIQEVLEALSNLHREAGGLGLEFSIDGLFVMAREGIPV